jgi:hypothetical protein
VPASARWAAAQSLTTGAIQGVVKDVETDQPLPGVTVTVGNQVAFTDGNGNYKITEVLPGTYDVVFTFEEASSTKTGVMVGANDVRNISIRMKIGEAIHVEGTADDIPIRTDSTAKEKRIKRDQIEKLPNPGQSAEDAIGGVPGTQNDGRRRRGHDRVDVRQRRDERSQRVRARDHCRRRWL